MATATSATYATLSASEHSTQLRRAVVASTIGTAIEWYDFFIYGTAAGLIFGKLYFPNEAPLTGTLAASCGKNRTILIYTALPPGVRRSRPDTTFPGSRITNAPVTVTGAGIPLCGQNAQSRGLGGAARWVMRSWGWWRTRCPAATSAAS